MADQQDQTRAGKLCSDANISQEHENDLEDTIQYMEEHRIPELFNELLTRILYERPDDAKERIVQMLKTVHKVQNKDSNSQRVYQILEQPEHKPNGEPIDQFLGPDDFESLFDSYDILGIQSVSLKYLAQAMQVVGIQEPEKILAERYPEICKDEYVNKVSFVYILQEEHNKLGFSFKKIE